MSVRARVVPATARCVARLRSYTGALGARLSHAAQSGRVSFSWRIGAEADPGRWTIVLSCGSAGTARKSFEVVCRRPKSAWVYVMNANGSRQSILASGSSPAWSPDGRKIAFDRDGDLWVMNADGSAQRKLADDGEYPDWSPDGRRIAFERKGDNYKNDFGDVDVYVMNADGSAQTKLASRGLDPDWSPDGRSIAFSDLWRSIVVMSADGTPIRYLTGDWVRDDPDWSPNGSRIAFATYGNTDDADWQVFVMNADGSGETRLTVGKKEFFPAWSPDGRRIAFASIGVKDAELFPGRIYVINADGSGRAKLTDTKSSAADDLLPAWSPNGAKIAFTRACALQVS